ncbi:MAG: pyridoxal phosphate-dependent aminotransferase [Ruminococcaceae bacterium]|nr:pyridoxal phosphate-dependent aminotransferase [Oscillospiraceae bacterium]
MISERLKKQLAGGSQIRKMFEEGNRLKAIYGADKVYDFSIGNPDLEPPHEVSDALKELAANPTPGMHGYMSNSGYESTRAAIAAKKSAESGLEIGSGAVCMTVGAASAMNDVLHSLLDPDDEVIVIAPYFMEYNGYIGNHGGKPVIVQTDDKFMPVISSIRDAITPKTKAIIINSPNNPSGVVYPASLLSELNDMLKAQDHVIHVISDEPYIDLVYDGMTVPCALSYIDNLIVCFSWSKSLSLPGERIGYTLVSPKNADYDDLTAAIVLSNRTLGSVNAPAIWQRVIEKSLNAKVDVSNYEHRRNLLYSNIVDAGFDAVKPNGALYIFMNTPEGLTDDKFSELCASKNLLLVKGSSFSRPGYCRLAFCVSESTIKNSRQAFFAIAEELGLPHRASL